MATEPSKDLAVFANPYPDRDYTIEFSWSGIHFDMSRNRAT